MGPNEHIIVELRDGRVLTLSNVVMNPTDYCGVLGVGDAASTKFCGGYAEVAAARSGGTPVTDQPDLTAPGPVETMGGSQEGK